MGRIKGERSETVLSSLFYHLLFQQFSKLFLLRLTPQTLVDYFNLKLIEIAEQSLD